MSDIINYIMQNPVWDAYKLEDADFLYFILLGTLCIHWDEIQKLAAYRAFSSVELKDGSICIRVLKSEL